MKAINLLFFAIIAFTLATQAVACPDPSAYGQTYSFYGKDLYSAKSFEVIAGGGNRLARCGYIQPRTDRGDGYFTTAPDFTFDLSGMSGYRIVVSVISQCDASLLVNTGSANWYYDDDDNGNLDPKIVLNRPSDGWLDVWVGTYDGSTCRAILTLETWRR